MLCKGIIARAIQTGIIIAANLLGARSADQSLHCGFRTVFVYNPGNDPIETFALLFPLREQATLYMPKNLRGVHHDASYNRLKMLKLLLRGQFSGRRAIWFFHNTLPPIKLAWFKALNPAAELQCFHYTFNGPHIRCLSHIYLIFLASIEYRMICCGHFFI